MAESKSRTVAYVRDGVPYNYHRQRLCEGACAACAAPFMSVASNNARYCSKECSAKHFTTTGRFAGANNPRWLGGVSTDNMRYRRRQRERWPERDAARERVRDAIDAGRLIRQPCETCSATPAEAHHDDYTRPLDVRWLCRTHHVEHHQTERRLARVQRVEAARP